MAAQVIIKLQSSSLLDVQVQGWVKAAAFLGQDFFIR